MAQASRTGCGDDLRKGRTLRSTRYARFSKEKSREAMAITRALRLDGAHDRGTDSARGVRGTTRWRGRAGDIAGERQSAAPQWSGSTYLVVPAHPHIRGQSLPGAFENRS